MAVAVNGPASTHSWGLYLRSLADRLTASGTIEEVALDLSGSREAQLALSTARRTLELFSIVDPDHDDVDTRLAGTLRDGRAMPLSRLAPATSLRVHAYAALERLFRAYDSLVTPTLAAPPFAIGLQAVPSIAGVPPDSPSDWHPFTYPFNHSGHPAISIPAGWTADGLPVALQVVGRRFADRDLLAVARLVETVQPWADRHPPLATPTPT